MSTKLPAPKGRATFKTEADYQKHLRELIAVAQGEGPEWFKRPSSETVALEQGYAMLRRRASG